ncbi:hypothetical protein QW180_21650 [Vibrio sinaloensis]|nr:hypothetical protein [Vibrio sinaloensis]
MQIKARVYKSSILQDLSSKRTLRIHQQYGNVQELSDIISQLELLTALLRQVTLDNQQPLLIASNKVDEIYASLNDYLSRFVSQVQKKIRCNSSSTKRIFFTTNSISISALFWFVR